MAQIARLTSELKPTSAVEGIECPRMRGKTIDPLVIERQER